MSGRAYILIGSLAASISVLAGAFGAHFLVETLGERADVYETAVRYQMYHALGMIVTGVLERRYPGATVRLAGWAFLAGILLFSGSLYALAILDLPVLGAVAPAGGLSFVAGWLLLGSGVWGAGESSRGQRKSKS